MCQVLRLSFWGGRGGWGKFWSIWNDVQFPPRVVIHKGQVWRKMKCCRLLQIGCSQGITYRWDPSISLTWTTLKYHQSHTKRENHCLGGYIWIWIQSVSSTFFHSRMGRVYAWNWTVCVCPSSLRRWSLFLLVGFTDPYNHTYSESLWWKLFKNHQRTQIQRQRQWQRQRQRHRKSAWKTQLMLYF